MAHIAGPFGKRSFSLHMMADQPVDFIKPCNIFCKKNVQKFRTVTNLGSCNGLNVFRQAVSNKIPGIAGVVDIGKCQAVYTCLCGCFYQFFSRKASVTEAEICFTVQIHRSSCLAYGSKCAGRSNQVHAKAVAYAVYGLGKFYHFLAVVEQRYLIVARNKMGKPYAN